MFGSRFALELAGGLVADVGRVGFCGVGRGDGFSFALVGVAGGGEVGEVVVVGDLTVLVFGGLVGAVCFEPPFGGGVALVVVGVDAAGGEFEAGALFGSAGGRGVGVPAGADVVGFLQLGGLPVEHVGEGGGFDGFAAQLVAAGLVGCGVGFGGA